jgi:hypothetical protein
MDNVATSPPPNYLIMSGENFEKNISRSIKLFFNPSNPFDYIEQFCNLNNLKIPEPDKTDRYVYDPNVVLDLMTHDYVIFFTTKYFRWFKKPLLNFFKKCDILCLNYYDKKFIERSIEQLNFFIKKMESGEILDLIKTKYKLRKLKRFCFFENSIEPNILYKKINFANEQLFISFDNYSIKRIEYKLKAFSQIAEKMGADKISIIYDKEMSQKINIDASVGINSGPTQSGIGGGYSNSNESTEQIKLGFDYSNDSHIFNLNKFDLVDTIQRENSFFLSKEEFNSDIDLNFLIDARCINLIKEYETELVFKHANEWEKKIFAHASKFKLNLDTKSYIKNDVNIKIKISFLNIYKHSESINGFNLYCFKEGFFHLCNLIRQTPSKESYLKIGNFLSSHFYYLNKGRFTIPMSFNQSIDLVKTHDDILKLNFNQDELSDLFKQFFEFNLNYSQFKNFRGIILKQPENFYDVILRHNYYGIEKKNFFIDMNSLTNKLLFISYQYHIIANYKLNLINKIKSHTLDIYTKLSRYQDNISINNREMLEEYKKKKYYIKKITSSSCELESFIKQTYPDCDNPIKKIVNPVLHRLLDYIKLRGLVIKIGNEHNIIINLISKLCACAKKYNTLIDKNNNNSVYSNFFRYAERYIYYLPNHFLDYETPEDIGNMDIDNSNYDSCSENTSDYDDFERSTHTSTTSDAKLTINDYTHDEISEFSFEKSNETNDNIFNVTSLDELLTITYKYVYISTSYLELFEDYKKNRIVYNPTDDINVLSNLIKIFTHSLDDYYKEENIEEIIFSNILFYNSELNYPELEKIIINCFNISFNIDNGLYEYVCTFGKKYDKTKINLVKELNSIIVNKSYEEKNSYNIVAQLLIPLIVYSLTPDDFEFDLDSYEKSPRADSYFGKTKTSLIKKVNNFIIKLVRNSNCDISENLDNYRKNTHLNYSKHRIFYTVEDLKQIITTSVKPSDQIKQLNSSISNYSLDQSKYIKELELKLTRIKEIFESNGFNIEDLEKRFNDYSDSELSI